MAIEGSLKCVKFLLFFFNLLFLLFGIALAIVGIVIASEFSNYIEVMGHGYNLAPILIIILGIIIAVVSFFGCFGAMRENRCLINFFAIALIILLVAEIVVVILAFVKRNEVEGAVDKVFNDIITEYNNNTKYHDFIDTVQRDLHCCGSNNYTDFYEFGVYKEKRVPTSCCIKEDVTTCVTVYGVLPGKHDFYEEGCKPRVINYLHPRIAIVGGIALAVCFIELLGIIFAYCLIRNIDHYEMV